MAPALLLAAASMPAGARGAEAPLPDDTADVVIGQPDFEHPFTGRTDARGLIAPPAVAVDARGTSSFLYVADPGNHRVLGYRLPLPAARPAPAALVIGQPDMEAAFFNEGQPGRDRLLTPAGLAVDPQGCLYVSDRDTHRIVAFDRPFETDTLADAVLGQAGRFDTAEPNRGGLSGASLDHPAGLAFAPPTDTLWVADTGNHRVLGYRSPRTTDAVADVVLGQPSFTTRDENAGGRSARSLYGPLCVSARGGILAVADTGNHRVLVYREPAGAGAPASQVLGQDDSFDAAMTGCSPFRLRWPSAVTLLPPDAAEAALPLLVSDTGNHRVLLFDLGPGATGQPVALWGQGRDLHSGLPNAGGLGPGTLSHPAGTAWAPAAASLAAASAAVPPARGADRPGTLWIADQGNHRVLGYPAARTGGAAAPDAVLGQIDLTHATPNFVDGLCLAFPRDVALDRSVEPNRLWICDFENNRVLGYRSTCMLGPGRGPDVIVGQPDAFSNSPGTGRRSLCLPSAVAVDAAGGLFVADRENNRVLWFENPFEKDTVADRVFGQPEFESRQPNNGGITARSLHRPEGVAVDTRGNLYVADTRNHRVLRFEAAVASDSVADAVWGQGGNFNTGAENGGAGARADTFSYPFGLDIRPDGLLAVADTNNHRVLIFDTNTDKGTPAIRLFGQQGDWTSRQENRGGCSGASLSGPENVAFWRAGLLVADTANCRIVYYDGVAVGAVTASRVYGQEGSFTRHGPPVGRTGAGSLWFPSGLDIDGRGNLYIADREQSRVLVFRAGSAGASAVTSLRR